MSLRTWPDTAGALGSVLSAVVAAFAAFGSRTASRQANKAATKAGATADLLAKIEQQRRHRELTPKFRVRGQVLDDSAYPGFAILFVMLSDGLLETLDAVTITILNTVEIQPWGLPEGVTEADAEGVLWSGWEFDTFLTGGVGQGAVKALSHRQSKPRSFSRREGKDWYQILLRRTAPPAWDNNWTEEKWRMKWETFPLRLSLDCYLAGHQSWIVYENVTVKPCDPKPDPADA
jgi:hypothetical protein